MFVLNDEAHHAYRFPEDFAAARVEAEEVREATVWIDGLERIHRHREILRAVDCSATPMYPELFQGAGLDALPVDHQRLRPGRRHRERAGKDPSYPDRRQHRDGNPQVPPTVGLHQGDPPKRTKPRRRPPTTDYLAEADGPLKQLAGAWEETFRPGRKPVGTSPRP